MPRLFEMKLGFPPYSVFMFRGRGERGANLKVPAETPIHTVGLAPSGLRGGEEDTSRAAAMSCVNHVAAANCNRAHGGPPETSTRRRRFFLLGKFSCC